MGLETEPTGTPTPWRLDIVQPYQQRVIDERNALDTKIDIMRAYSATLRGRIALFNKVG